MRPSTPSLPRRLIGPVLLAACVLTAGRGEPADPPPKNDKAKPVETSKVELHRLTNDDLLKQTAGIYDKAAQDYRAAGRALASAEILFEEAAKQADAPDTTEVPGPRPLGPVGKEPTAEDKARAAGEAAKAK